MDFSASEEEEEQEEHQLVSGRRAAYVCAGEEGRFVRSAHDQRAASRRSGVRLARQLYPQRFKEVSSMYRNLCRCTGKNHRGVRRRAYIAACVLYVSLKENSAYLPGTFRQLLEKACVSSNQLLRSIQSMMSMGIRWTVPVDFNSMVVRPALEHGFRVHERMDLPESGKPSDTAAAFYLCTSASLGATADLFGVDVRQLELALTRARSPNGAGRATKVSD